MHEGCFATSDAELICLQDLHAPEALGSALVQVLLERHGALPAEVECGLLLAAHSCYEAGSCADALEVLVQLAQRAMQQWAQSGDWRPLAQLISGESQPLPGAERFKPSETPIKSRVWPKVVQLIKWAGPS